MVMAAADPPGVPSLVNFVKAIGRLAMPAEQQVAYLEDIGTAPSADELALEFDEGFVLLPTFVERGWLSAHDAKIAAAIDESLGRMSGEQGPWDIADLATAPEWQEIRRLAATPFVKGFWQSYGLGMPRGNPWA